MAHMVSEVICTSICIDIGMTGSAASWRNNQGQQEWADIYKVKVPTKVFYDPNIENGSSVAWGTLVGGTNLVGGVVVREFFKAFMGDNSVNYSPPYIVTKPNAKRYMQEFMIRLCGQVVTRIDKEVGGDWKAGKVQWNFTVPGSWPEYPLVADYRRLAETAIGKCIGNRTEIKVTTDIKEAQASALCMLQPSSGAFSRVSAVDNIVLSCDIGSATTDIAVSQIEAPSLITPALQLNIHPEGSNYVDNKFGSHVQAILESAGASNSSDMARQIWASGLATISGIKTTFNGEEEQREWFDFRIPPQCEVVAWPQRGNRIRSTTRIQEVGGRKVLCIHKETILEWFDEFTMCIEAAIDWVINSLKEQPSEKHLAAIGICGGGANMAYPVNRLRRQYHIPGTVVFDPKFYTFRPEMATIIGAGLLHDQQVVNSFCSKYHVGIKAKNDIFWKEDQDMTISSDVQTSYGKQVKFAKSKKPFRSAIVENELVVALIESSTEVQRFSEVANRPDARTWKVQIDLEDEEARHRFSKTNYEVICTIRGEWQVAIEAETVAGDGRPARRLPCELIWSGKRNSGF